MAEDFDPYHKWLGIPPAQQPAHHYRLLGVDLFESDADVIANAADRQIGHVRSMATGPYAAASQKLLNELATAKLCLLDPRRRAGYDAQLRADAPPADEEPPVYATVAGPPAEDAAWDEAATPEISGGPRRRGRRSSLGLGIRLCGHVAASVGGLALGYWVLCSIGPQYDFLGLVADAATSEPTGDADLPKAADGVLLESADQSNASGFGGPATNPPRPPAFGSAPPLRTANGAPPLRPAVTPQTTPLPGTPPGGRSPTPRPMPPANNPTVDNPQVNKPPKPVEPAELAEPEPEFPRHVDLPPVAEVGEMPLGIPLGAQFAALRLELLANPLAEDDLRRPRLREDAASGGRQWSVVLAADGAGLESLHAVARIVLRGGELHFAWTPGAAGEPKAGQLRNALLEVAVEGKTRPVALRSPLRLSPLTFTLEQKRTLLRLDLPDAPATEQLRLTVAAPGLPVTGQFDPAEGVVPFGRRVAVAFEPGLELRLLSSTTTSGPALTLSGVYRLPELNAEDLTAEQLTFHKGTLEKQLTAACEEKSQREGYASSLPAQLQAVADRPLSSNPNRAREEAHLKNKEMVAIRKEIRKNTRLLDALKIRIPKIEANLAALESVVQVSARLDKQVSLRVRLEYEVAGRTMLLADTE